MGPLTLSYCLADVYLQSIVGIADSLYNLRLIRSFCDKYIPNKTCHFTYEDMLYTKQPLKENFLVMVSELFYWFEIRPLSVVTGGKKVVTPVSGEGDGRYHHRDKNVFQLIEICGNKLGFYNQVVRLFINFALKCFKFI